MGMSIQDFDSLLPSEFGEVLEQWRKEQTRKENTWLAGIRLHAAICIQPWCSGSISPSDLFTIPEIDDYTPDAAPEPERTPEERKAEYEELKKASGFL